MVLLVFSFCKRKINSQDVKKSRSIISLKIKLTFSAKVQQDQFVPSCVRVIDKGLATWRWFEKKGIFYFAIGIYIMW